jgi:tRNA (guanine10-N2)-methyltransferase
MRFLLRFVTEAGWRDFPINELEAVLSMVGVTDAASAWSCGPIAPELSPALLGPRTPFIYVDVDSEETIVSVADRLVMCSGVFEVCGDGDTVESCAAASIAAIQAGSSFARHVSADLTFRLDVESYGKHFTKEEHGDIRAPFLDGMEWPGRVRMKGADREFVVLLDFACGVMGAEGKTVPRAIPLHVWFARRVAPGRRDLPSLYSLKRRSFLGPTATDARLALLMANMAQVRPGSCVWDPFVGTGSILVAAAAMGATWYCGSDIDWNILQG